MGDTSYDTSSNPVKFINISLKTPDSLQPVSFWNKRLKIYAFPTTAPEKEKKKKGVNEMHVPATQSP